MSRDFTYIDDLVEGIVRLSAVIPSEENRVTQEGVTDTLSHHAPFRVVNIGGGQPVELMHFVETVEKRLGNRRSATCCRCSRVTFPALSPRPIF